LAALGCTIDRIRRFGVSRRFDDAFQAESQAAAVSPSSPAT